MCAFDFSLIAWKQTSTVNRQGAVTPIERTLDCTALQSSWTTNNAESAQPALPSPGHSRNAKILKQRLLSLEDTKTYPPTPPGGGSKDPPLSSTRAGHVHAYLVTAAPNGPKRRIPHFLNSPMRTFKTREPKSSVVGSVRRDFKVQSAIKTRNYTASNYSLWVAVIYFIR